MTQATTDTPQWRGIASEQAEEISGKLGTLLRRRSRRLLKELLGPTAACAW